MVRAVPFGHRSRTSGLALCALATAGIFATTAGQTEPSRYFRFELVEGGGTLPAVFAGRVLWMEILRDRLRYGASLGEAYLGLGAQGRSAIAVLHAGWTFASHVTRTQSLTTGATEAFVEGTVGFHPGPALQMSPVGRASVTGAAEFHFVGLALEAGAMLGAEGNSSEVTPFVALLARLGSFRSPS